jgi:hypothetical protein
MAITVVVEHPLDGPLRPAHHYEMSPSTVSPSPEPSTRLSRLCWQSPPAAQRVRLPVIVT